MMRQWQRGRIFRVAMIVLLTAGQLSAAEIYLKNGVILDGKPIPIQAITRVEIDREIANDSRYYPILMVHSGIKRYFVPAKQVEQIDHAGGLLNLEEYEIPQKYGSRRQMLQTLGGVKVNQDFDQYGRRTVSFRVNGELKPVVQGITQINPKYVTVNAITDYAWEHAISTTAIPEDTLGAVLRKTIDVANPQQRMGLAVFYMQAGLYVRAGNELDSIIQDFPELKDTATEVITKLRSTQAGRLLQDLRERIENGQFQLARLALKTFPTKNVTADILKEVSDLARQLDEIDAKLGRVNVLLSRLQRAMDDKTEMGRLEAMRTVVRKELDGVSVERLDAFLKLADDDTLTAGEKLSLAYSGWLLGSAYAITDLEQTIRYWQAHRAIVEYLITHDSTEQTKSLATLKTMEGITPEVVSHMLTHIKPVIETPGIEPGVPFEIELEADDPDLAVKYHVLLPQEYTPNRAYPLIVALHPLERNAALELSWWGGTAANPGQSQRHGAIVIAPEYINEKLNEYDYAARSHYITLKAIRDARTRFHINSDKVFLSGHGMGGDAAFDIGMSHPDVFAGVIPISALARHYCKWYWQNAKHVPWYLVSGELCRNSLLDADHSAVIGRMMRYGHEFDVISSEYIGRGYEHYYEEIHELFAWMKRQERRKDVQEVEATILRPNDNRFYWVKTGDFSPQVLQGMVLDTTGRKLRVRPTKLQATILSGSEDHTLINLSSAGKTHVISLNPELVDYKKRLWVRLRGRREFNDFPEPSLETMLDDFRERADRQNLIWTEIVIQK